MIDLPSGELIACAGIGVAGNFAGHLEQAGEAAGFDGVEAAEQAPKGIFPWYLPGAGGAIGQFPLCADRLRIPEVEAGDLQIEPEVGVLFDVRYEAGLVVGLTPIALGAFNDCSIRRPGAEKISIKKNWGACSAGFATACFELDEVSRESVAHLRLACILRREGTCSHYGVDSPVAGYSYFGGQLDQWLIDRLQSQRDGDGPLEDVGAQLRECGLPAQMLIGVGATRYTAFGESNFLRAGDESIVIVYDERFSTPTDVFTAAQRGEELGLASASVLSQKVTTASRQNPTDAARPT